VGGSVGPKESNTPRAGDVVRRKLHFNPWTPGVRASMRERARTEPRGRDGACCGRVTRWPPLASLACCEAQQGPLQRDREDHEGARSLAVGPSMTEVVPGTHPDSAQEPDQYDRRAEDRGAERAVVDPEAARADRGLDRQIGPRVVRAR
jgi:hypothetical protein